MNLPSYYFGMIDEVYPPNDVRNYSKYQYEYQVLIIAEDYASIPVRCIREDRYGSRDNFEDIILDVATKVMVMFPRGDKSMGIIQHGTRAYVAPQNPALGIYWMNRFNKVVRGIDQNGNYSVTSDSGPTLQVNTSTIVLDDTTGESIVIDKAAQTITIKANTWSVTTVGDANIQVGGKAAIQVTGDADLNVTGNLTAECADLTVKSSGDAKVTANSVSIQGESGMVLTTETDPVIDSIFGEPTMGVPTFKAGQ
jgi:hypothetical protein